MGKNGKENARNYERGVKRMNIFYILIGLAAGGKSTVANRWAASVNGVVCSSDKVREELYGDESIQGSPQEVFFVLFNKAVEAYKTNTDVFYDATNLSRKKRIQLVENLNRFGITNIHYIFVATDFLQCLKNNQNRERKVPTSVLFKMREAFSPLSPDEYNMDSNRVHIVRPFPAALKTRENAFYKNNFSHDNPNHSLYVSQHMKKAGDYITFSPDFNDVYLEKTTRLYTCKDAAYLHDVGKCETKVYTDSTGKLSNVAHYYRHENVGAYESFFYVTSNYSCGFLYRAALIGYHMLPYSYHTNDMTVIRNKLLKKFKVESFVDDLLLLYEADLAAH